MERQNLTIGCLSLSAVLLFVALLATSAFNAPHAEASGMTTSAGQYTMLTGRLNPSNEAVYIINSRANKMAVYRLNESRGNIEIVQVMDIGGAKGGQQGGNRQKLKP
jgi:hypothetical protein